MRVLAFMLTCAIASMASADVVDVNIWKSLPGKNSLTIEYAAEAVAIQTKLGAAANAAVDTEGRVHTSIAFKSWTEWAAFGRKLQADKGWQKFLARIGKNPSAEMEANYMLNTPGSEKVGGVYHVVVWKPELGRMGDVLQAAQQAKMIHEKAGASVNIMVDQSQNLHYVMNFADWEAWAKVQDTPSAEFQAFMQEQSKDPVAEVMKVYIANSL